MKNLVVENKLIGLDQPCFIVAEMSANHQSSLDVAKEIVRAAKRAGADAIKFQTYRADTITLDVNNEDFKIYESEKWGKHTNFYSLYDQACMPWDWHEELFKLSRELGLIPFSSPFDISAVEFLEKLDNPIYKIASPEITDIPLIKKVAATQRPVILSTGLADFDDINLAIKTIKNQGNDKIILLKCTTSYPAPDNEVNLDTILQYQKDFQVLTGLSDHTEGWFVPVLSRCMKGVLVEKHFKLNGDNTSIDSFFSLPEDDFKLMVDYIRRAEIVIGDRTYEITSSAKKNLNGKRSLYVSKAVKKGEVISESNIKSVRPGYGLHPRYYEEVLGKTAKRNLMRGERLCLIDLD